MPKFRTTFFLGQSLLLSTTVLNDSVPSLLVGTIGVAHAGIKPSTHMFSIVDSSIVDKPNLDIFWNFESIGIVDSPLTSNDDQALKTFNSTVKFDNGRYQVSWP